MRGLLNEMLASPYGPKECLCTSRRPHANCPIHGPVLCQECGSRQPGHAEGCFVIEPDDGTPSEVVTGRTEQSA